MGPVRLGMVRIGLAMLQGARHEHIEALHVAAGELSIPLEVVELRKGDQVDASLDGLILPGGESTAMRKASESEALLPALYAWMDEHTTRPVLGTCAGAILLSAPGGNRAPYITAPISRNAWGRQRQSFEANVEIILPTPQASNATVSAVAPDQFNRLPLPVAPGAAPLPSQGHPGVFIRAPRFETEAVGCEVVATLGDEVVGVLDGHRLALTFHPELTLDRRFHRWLLAQADHHTSDDS
jgi:5'-phosphate synthase pdxT subunit